MNQQTDIQLINQLCKEKILHINPIVDKGKVNRIYAVKTENKHIVIRLNEANEIGRFKKEQWCMEKASACGIPSSQVIDLGVKDHRAFMLLNFITGVHGEDATEKDYIWRKLGSYAQKIHSIPTIGFSETMTQAGIFNDTWERYVTYNIESLHDKDKLLSMNVLSYAYSVKLKDIFKTLLKKQFTFGLSHNDLSLANVIVEDEFVTLIDWGSAESTVIPHFELIGILEDSLQEKDPLFNAFLEGYGMSQQEFEDMKPDIISLTLLKAVDKLRWAIDRKPEMIQEYSDRVKKLTAQLL